jgi:hypothetical protein
LICEDRELFYEYLRGNSRSARNADRSANRGGTALLTYAQAGVAWEMGILNSLGRHLDLLTIFFGNQWGGITKASY